MILKLTMFKIIKFKVISTLIKISKIIKTLLYIFMQKEVRDLKVCFY